MITGEHQISCDRLEQPSAKAAEQNEAETARQLPASGPWYHRVLFWRSVAGMAIAIALGCAAIALEMTSELSSRSANFHRRLQLLSLRSVRLHTEAANAERQLAAMRDERLARIKVNSVLSAPDVVVLRLMPGTGSNIHGLIAISRQEGAAIIEISGLSATPGHTSVLWWLLAHGPPAKGAEFGPSADGRLSRAIQIPPRGTRIVGVIVTLGSEKSPSKPGGRILLRGVLPSPQVLS
jgi:Anti-sigma-K factor rskA, C-terminal